MEAAGASISLDRHRQTAVGDARGVTVRVLGVAASTGLCLYAAHSLLGLGGRRLDGLFENWVFNALFLAAAALCLLRGLWCPIERRAWLTLGTGLACWALGEILYTLDPGQVSSGSFPAASDYLWLVFYPAAFLALGLLVRARVRQFYPSLWLDGIVGATAVGAAASQFVLPAIVAGTGGSLINVVADLIYPLADVLLLGFVIAVLAVSGWRPGRALGTVGIGLGLGAIADILSTYMSATGHTGATVFDSLWPASALTLGWAAWRPIRPPGVIGLQGRRLLLFPLGFALIAIGLLALQEYHPLNGTAYILAVITIAGTTVRMGLTFSENLRLMKRTRREALTDPLTGLGNRRRLMIKLEDVLRSASARDPWALLLFDLNGFKLYNDAFGHPAGDALLIRLGAKLAAAVAPEGLAYRMGGDEFCVLVRLGDGSTEAVLAAAAAALSERGDGFDISSARGCIRLPEEAQDSSTALQLVDERLYSDKRASPSSDAPDQLRNVLLQVLAEHQPGLDEHLRDVATMAQAVGRRMGLQGEDLEHVVRAAELHDVGKVAVPNAILQKPAALEPGERTIIERHSEAGERILASAAAMVPVARIVRASHERFDGGGYPDRRAGADIPLGARIVAVCDAYDAMISDRPYRPGVEPAAAIAELRRVAGTQFDPEVVEVFCAEFAAMQAGPPNGATAVPDRMLERG